MKVYLSGPITNRKKFKEKFEEARLMLEGVGHTVFDPSLTDPAGKVWEDFMKIDIPEVCKCDMVYVLPGWKKSKGARYEVKTARLLKIPVISYKTGRTI